MSVDYDWFVLDRYWDIRIAESTEMAEMSKEEVGFH